MELPLPRVSRMHWKQKCWHTLSLPIISSWFCSWYVCYLMLRFEPGNYSICLCLSSHSTLASPTIVCNWFALEYPHTFSSTRDHLMASVCGHTSGHRIRFLELMQSNTSPHQTTTQQGQQHDVCAVLTRRVRHVRSANSRFEMMDCVQLMFVCGGRAPTIITMCLHWMCCVGFVSFIKKVIGQSYWNYTNMRFKLNFRIACTYERRQLVNFVVTSMSNSNCDFSVWPHPNWFEDTHNFRTIYA